MATQKQKSSQDLQSIFDAIQDVLINIKPKLAESSLKRPPPSDISGDLQRVTILAESFSQNRSRTNQDWLPLADALDREGVHLWNMSSQLRDVEDDEIRAVFVALRLAGFRLIEAGLESKPTTETLLHVLQIASKAGACLSEIGRNDVAAAVLACAAKYEESVRTAGDMLSAQLEQAKARAVVLYHSSRMEVACREGNDGVAEFMLQKIFENEHRLSLLQPRDQLVLAAKLLEIGKSIIRASRINGATVEPARAQDSVKWLQKAFTLIEHAENKEAPGYMELKRLVLSGLARAYFLASTNDGSNLDRAEASLDELILSIDPSERGSSEHQQLRWMRVAILKRRKAADPQLLEAFKSIIDHMDLNSEQDVTELVHHHAYKPDSLLTAVLYSILQELRALSQHHELVTAAHQHGLRIALETQGGVGFPHIDRLLLSLVVHCSRDENHTRAMQDMATAFSCLSESEFSLPKIPTTACLTLLWQFGDRQYSAKRWMEAADWFLAGTHPALSSMARASRAKCFRKAALCYIQQRDFTQASAILRRCPSDEATTQYVTLLTAVHQGLETEAIRAVQAMVKASDFDRKMLLLATQLANESDMKSLLLSVLEELLRTLDIQDNLQFDVETLALIRCIIRLVVKLIGEPAPDRVVLVPTLIRHFRTAHQFVSDLHDKDRATIVSKDISWLWRTAYNCAVQGCSEWEDMDEAVSDLFDIARMLLEVYCATALTEVDAEVYGHIANASFAAVAGRMFATRRRLVSGSTMQDLSLNNISDEIMSCKNRIQEMIHNDRLPTAEDADRVRYFIHVLWVFQVEVLCLRKEWKQILFTIQEATRSDRLTLNTFEAIADLVWAEKDCPVDALFAALEAILHASLDQMSLSVTKFSRWLRAICTILLSRNTPADRTKAIGYIEQAVVVLEEHGDIQDGNDVYPLDERQWLLGTAYNTGIECLHASRVDEAKRWFESSTVICRFVPGGDARAEKIAETYTQLLNRFAPNGSNLTDPNP